ncbi:E3 ubiquitin-protein ligase UBR1 isoform X2 [Teleopsis dalmanni]|uniref:E3 ubiquitin-protein ligase UBR1 isoform X2 n=1 Tax=Teleopsis dalmanni TaxID=139649 RepID=UPI0018CCCB1F|nr:E3 ubiquitin-protein ligase UBR1 isoform X2 [Teleopsis dalmanni]
MDRFDMEDVVPPITQVSESPLKDWRLKYQTGTIQKNDFMEFFRKQVRKYFHFERDRVTGLVTFRKGATNSRTVNVWKIDTVLKCAFKESEAKEGIILTIMEFMLGDNPKSFLEKLHKEGNTASVCGRVFKNGEPTYTCRECGMDPTCVLCVGCFKQSEHRFHKYKMSTSGGGGCCDCGDEEAWKKDYYCAEHLRGKENPKKTTLITDAIMERCEIAFSAILSYCITFLEIEPNASLKCLDSDGDPDDNYCTLLYNDESHTFDQVIQTLTKYANFPDKESKEIVGSIDREGRAVIKCDTFFECCQLREAVERQSAAMGAAIANSQHPLRVTVLHVYSMACQQFALQLLSWLQDLLGRCSLFRQVFAKLLMDKKAPYSILHIFEYDVKLWKQARTAWHRLLISGMLMEYDNKLALAREFSKHYATVMQDFIRDDHDHSYSIVSLSVQLFTVPSIAHYLIADEGIFYKLLHTFYHEAIAKFIQNKTVHFDKSTSNGVSFKRSAFILYDLRYILSFPPDSWTPDLRNGFIEGCRALLRILNVMQGMEHMVRQTGQHMDYEPEWESAFNLHIKLANAITMVVEWSATDKEVLEKFYLMIMQNLVSNGFIVNSVKQEEKSVAGHVAKCLMYDVGSKPVSIHLPLSRIFAGIYLRLGAHGLTYDALSVVKRTPEELMEPILCAQVMIAQVNSGMWRRNGYSLLHQLYFYRNVRCRLEMLDRDIQGLQIGASLIESNVFLIHLLNKFNLIDWVQTTYETNLTNPVEDDFIRQLAMIDEFLELLIVIIGERYIPGISNITEEDRTKKEMIQLLCIKPLSHSELNRAVPESNNDTALEDVTLQVADFKKPLKNDAKGVFELKSEYYNDYNMFYYHYTKEDKSKSEEVQRLKRKKENELVCCPPPKLPKLTEAFFTIPNLLQCDVMMHIFSIILDRAIDLKAKSFLENHLQKILFLIGFGLQEEQSGNYPYLTFFNRATENNFLQKLEELSHSQRVEAHRDFILWTIKKLKEFETRARSEPMQSEDDEANIGEKKSEAISSSEQERIEKKERARLAAEKRAKVLAQIQNAQKLFMSTNAELFANTSAVAQPSEGAMEWQDDNEGAVAYKTVACLGVDRRLQQPEELDHKCILCFEDCKVSCDGTTLVYSAYIQKSKILPLESPKRNFSLYTSTCGHVMHVECWKEYFSNEETKDQRRPNRIRPALSANGQLTEFYCPYCRCLSNTVLPLTASLSKFSTPNIIHAGDEIFPIDNWIEMMKNYSDELNKLCREEDRDMWIYSLPTCASLLKNENVNNFLNILNPVPKPQVGAGWTTAVQYYVKAARQQFENIFEDNETESLLFIWESCSYTVQAMEIFLRAINQPLKNELSIRHNSCLNGIIRTCCFQSANINTADYKNIVSPVAELLETVFKQKNESVLEWNCFSKMVSMIFMIPNLLYATSETESVVPNGSMLEFYMLELCFLANLVKALVLFEAPDEECYMDIDADDLNEIKDLPEKIVDNITSFYCKYNLAARRQAQAKCNDAKDDNVTDIFEEQIHPANIKCDSHIITALFDHIKMEMREFLRCSCIFFKFVTDVDFPEELGQCDSDTFDNMCKYLGLKTNLEVYFENESAYPTIIEMFASHHDILRLDVITNRNRQGRDLKIVPCIRPVPHLVVLPEDYSDLINSVSDFICPNNEREEMRTPTMCLICGEILCGQSYCCQPNGVGACTHHASFCSSEIGIFLRIRDCHIVYLGRKKGCFIPPPYIDEYGEADQGLRRGNPLRLCKERYKQIHLKWLGHGLIEEIARQMDSSTQVIAQWVHM